MFLNWLRQEMYQRTAVYGLFLARLQPTPHVSVDKTFILYVYQHSQFEVYYKQYGIITSGELIVNIQRDNKRIPVMEARTGFHVTAWNIKRFHDGAWRKALTQDYREALRWQQNKTAQETKARFRPLD